MYLAFVRASGATEKAASKSTFYGIARQWLDSCLGIRRKIEHAMGLECQTLRSAIHQARNFETHAKLCDKLLHHFQETWADRMCYWLARDRAQKWGDILVAIADSFDKSKLHLPSWPYKRTPKRAVYEQLLRGLDCLMLEHALDLSFLVLTLVTPPLS